MSNLAANSQTAATASLDELLSLHDERFVRHAYLLLLGREVDSSGLANCVQQLKRGVAKAQIIVALVDSEEGRIAEVQLPGLADMVRANRLRPPSLPRRVAARISRLLLAPLAPQLRAIENEVHAIGDRAEQQFNSLHAAISELNRGRPHTAGPDASDLNAFTQQLATDLMAGLGRPDLTANAGVIASRLGVALNAHRRH